MAERRMFHTGVVESDAFLDLPLTAQALYFHIGMHADDDGFVNGPRQITRKIGAGVRDLDLLVSQGFLLRFEDVVVVKHWRIANSLQNDRLKPLRYPEVAKQLYLRENRSYTLSPQDSDPSLFLLRQNELQGSRNPTGFQLDSNWNPNLTEPNRNKPNINESNAAETDGIHHSAAADRELQYINGNLGKGVVLMTQEQIGSLLDIMGLDSFDFYVEKLADFILKNGAKVKSHYATILKWWQEDRGILDSAQGDLL